MNIMGYFHIALKTYEATTAITSSFERVQTLPSIIFINNLYITEQIVLSINAYISTFIIIIIIIIIINIIFICCGKMLIYNIIIIVSMFYFHSLACVHIFSQ